MHLKNLPKALACLLVSLFCHRPVSAQFAPSPSTFSIVSQPGATLSEIIDTMRAHTDPNDTAEGNETADKKPEKYR